eukprot:747435-Hanusia_phi.AAC.1
MLNDLVHLLCRHGDVEMIDESSSSSDCGQDFDQARPQDTAPVERLSEIREVPEEAQEILMKTTVG